MTAAVAPPAEPPPSRRTLRQRLRALRAGSRPGVTVEGLPLLGRGVVLDVAAGARLVLEDGCVLGDGCRLHVRGGVARIGAGAVLGERCTLLCHEAIEVGSRSRLGDGVVLVDAEHAHDDIERPVRLQRLLTAPVRVGERARIGPGAALERGARVPAGGVVEANQVVPERPAPLPVRKLRRT